LFIRKFFVVENDVFHNDFGNFPEFPKLSKVLSHLSPAFRILASEPKKHPFYSASWGWLTKPLQLQPRPEGRGADDDVRIYPRRFYGILVLCRKQKKISGEDHVMEIARMLSGSSITPEAVANERTLSHL